MQIDTYLIPYIDELLDRLAKARIYSKLDLASRYHKIRMATGHGYKTAFLTCYGTYE